MTASVVMLMLLGRDRVDLTRPDLKVCAFVLDVRARREQVRVLKQDAACVDVERVSILVIGRMLI